MDLAYQRKLFQKLLEGQLTPEQTAELVDWLSADELDTDSSNLLLAQIDRTPEISEANPELVAALEARLAQIDLRKDANRIRRIPFYKKEWMKYAAAIVVLICISLFFFIPKNKDAQKQPLARIVPVTAEEFAPGKEGAILTLADGRTILLDSLGNGIIASENGAELILKDGQLLYNSEGIASTELLYNTITTPRGRQFQLVLPDRSKVWLNAASSLTYPVVFTGKNRRVQITGEAYFEVAPDANSPFLVEINDQTSVEVLGTHFNINSYRNEASINTTLLEGSVRVINGPSTSVIKPGQQARVSPNSSSSISVVNNVNLDKVMAWKNGVFDFQDASLQEVMRQLERWYDIEVVYEKGIPNLEFMGKMGRDLTLAEVLRGLEMSEVNFEVKEGKLVVTP